MVVVLVLVMVVILLLLLVVVVVLYVFSPNNNLDFQIKYLLAKKLIPSYKLFSWLVYDFINKYSRIWLPLKV